MTETLTAGTGTSSMYNVWDLDSKTARVETHNLFDAVVIAANELELRPKSELAKYLLHMWLGGDVERAGRMRGDWKPGYGAGFEALCFKFASKPLLTKGNDPYHTGMTISTEEQEACRKLVDEMRAAKRPKVRTARRRRLK